MEEITIEEILTIIRGYADVGASSISLAKTYSILSERLPARKEKESNKEKEIKEKILSLISGKQDKDRRQSEEIKQWVQYVVGEWTIVQLFSELAITTKQQKDAAKQLLRWLVSKGIIEHIGVRSGVYRTVTKDYDEQKWWENDGKAAPLRFPLGMHDLVKVLPGSVILLEGQKSQGKTSWGLEFARLNRYVYEGHKVRYLNVEMSNGEIQERMKSYQAHDMWQMSEAKDEIEFIRRYSDWWDLISPDGITVVDYVRDSLEAYKIAHYIELIHAKIKDGISLVIVQRDPNKMYGSGGYNIRSIPRLIVSLQNHVCKIEDTKHFWQPPNPSGMAVKYKLAGNGVKWMKDQGCEWEDQERMAKQEKYSGVVDRQVKKEGGYI